MTPRRTFTAGLTAAVIGGLLSAVPQSATADPHQDPEQRVIVTLSGAAAATGKGTLRSADASEIGADRASSQPGRKRSSVMRRTPVCTPAPRAG